MIEISAADVTAAEEFLASVVSERVPAGKYTDGTALRDLTIKALAVISAQLRKDNNTVQSLQSLLRIRQIASTTSEANLDPAVADAADAILSNLFFKRKSGAFARGLVRVYVSRRQDYTISRASSVFYFDRSRAFLPDASTDIVIRAADLSPVTDASGAVIAYYFPLRLVAVKTGEEYNVTPGTWAGTGGFSPFVMRVTSSVRFEGGKPRQGTLDLISSAQDGMAVRNLINERSIRATLTQEFSYLSRLVVVGMGDPEMQRDNIAELATGFNAHIGGAFDVYLDLAPAETVYEGIVGGAYVRPDGVVNVFTDATIADWVAAGVLAGDVLRVTGGMTDAPRDYVISGVETSALQVSTSRPFTEATGNVSYYIYRPLFGADVSIVPTTGTLNTGVTSAIVQTSNRIVLPGEPHYGIVDVAITNPGADPYVNAADGLVHFTTRINDTPVLPADPNEDLPFRVIGRNPKDALSSRCFDEIELPSGYNGKRVRVKYYTLAGFASIDSYTRDRFQRVLAANVQAKGFHPVYLSFRIPYRLSPLAANNVNELRLRQSLVAYINSFDPRDVIDQSDITTYLRTLEPNIGTLFNFTINYGLALPDGRLVSFSTEDIVSIDPERYAAGTTLRPTRTELLSMSISDRTVRYLTELGSVHLEAR